jgi:hypothetical protein
VRAWLALRPGVEYRREAFKAGLEACGYEVRCELTERPGPDDVLVTWNRYGQNDRVARLFEAKGLPVLVAENGYLGNDFAGAKWYAISRNQHNGCGSWPEGGADRWDSLGVKLEPWRSVGEVVILAQRGIGPEGVAMPPRWCHWMQGELAKKGVSARLRPHPGRHPAPSLEQDLAKAGCVVTWSSGAALKALMMGVPVYHGLIRWIGKSCAKPAHHLLREYAPFRDDAARLDMFRRLAWAQWRLEEIESGEAFRRLL